MGIALSIPRIRVRLLPPNAQQYWMKHYVVAMKLLPVSFLAKEKEHKMKAMRPVVRKQEAKLVVAVGVPKAGHKYLNLGLLLAR